MLMGTTWIPIYETALSHFVKKHINELSRPMAWANGWAKSLTLQHIAPSPHVTHTQEKEFWAALWNCQYPPGLFGFVYTASWSKLKVQQRILSICSTD